MSRSPAFELVLACSAWPPSESGDARIRAAAAAADWAEVLAKVARHRVPGLVHAALSRTGADVPPAVLATLHAQRIALTRHNLAQAAETVALRDKLAAAGIAAIFFKGATLALQIHGSLTVKHSKDIDFLVSPGDIGRCVELLEREGYRLWLPARRLSVAQWRTALRDMKEVAMVNARRGFQVEPHWRLTDDARLIDASAMAVRKIELLPGRPVDTFARDDLFAYLCVHGTVSAWFRLKWLSDVHALLADASDDEIERLLEHADSHDAGHAAALALMLCSTLFDRSVPDRVAGLFRASRRLRALHRLVLLNLAGGEAAARILSIPFVLINAQLHGRLARQLWMLANAEAVRLPLPRTMHWLHPLLRLPLFIIRRLGARRTPLPVREEPA